MSAVAAPYSIPCSQVIPPGDMADTPSPDPVATAIAASSCPQATGTSAPWTPTEAQEALAFAQSMATKWPRLMRHCRPVNSCHAALVLALQQAASSSSPLSLDEGQHREENKEDSLLYGCDAEEGCATLQVAIKAADTPTKADVQRLQQEVVQLQAQYEPFIGDTALSVAAPATGKSLRTRSVEVEESPELLDSLLKAAQNRFTEAKGTQEAVSSQVKEVVAPEEGLKHLPAVKAQHRRDNGEYKPAKELDAGILTAVVKVEEAEEDVREMEEAVAESQLPWRVAARLQNRCIKLKAFIVALALAVVASPKRESPMVSPSGVEGGRGEKKSDNGASRFCHGVKLQQTVHQGEAMAVLTSLVGPYQGMQDASAEQKSHLGGLWAELVSRQTSLAQAQADYEAQQQEWRALVSDEEFREWLKAAKSADGRYHPRPQVLKLHRAYEGVKAAEARHREAMIRVRELEAGEPAVGKQLLWLEKELDVVWRGFPALLQRLTKHPLAEGVGGGGSLGGSTNDAQDADNALKIVDAALSTVFSDVLPGSEPGSEDALQRYLMNSIRVGSVPKVRVALAAGAAYDKEVCMDIINNGSMKVRRLLPLSLAALEGREDIVKLLLEQGADVNQQSTDDRTTALMAAAVGGNAAVCEILLEKGADVNQEKACIGGTALIAAAAGGHAPVCKLLLEKGVVANQARAADGWTALMAAAKRGHVSVCELLLEKGADVNQACTHNGCTALMAAAKRGHVLVCELLLEKGAAVNQGTHGDRWNELIRTSSSGYTEVDELLLKKGGVVDHSRIGLTALGSGS